MSLKTALCALVVLGSLTLAGFSAGARRRTGRGTVRVLREPTAWPHLYRVTRWIGSEVELQGLSPMPDAGAYVLVDVEGVIGDLAIQERGKIDRLDNGCPIALFTAKAVLARPRRRLEPGPVFVVGPSERDLSRARLLGPEELKQALAPDRSSDQLALAVDLDGDADAAPDLAVYNYDCGGLVGGWPQVCVETWSRDDAGWHLTVGARVPRCF